MHFLYTAYTIVFSGRGPKRADKKRLFQRKQAISVLHFIEQEEARVNYKISSFPRESDYEAFWK
jgi:hypothetical protein